MNMEKVILFGGNGFVGTAIAQKLVEQNITPICVSRTGTMPVHLEESDWVQKAQWIEGNARNPDMQLLSAARAVVTLVGSPPVPTFSKKAYNQQLMMNSEPNLAVIEAVAKSEVSRLVLIGAHIPTIMRTDKFAYAKGKRLCEEAACKLVEESNQHSAVVLKPSGIYGSRYTKTGKAINIGSVMRPIARLQSVVPEGVRSYLPETLVSVNAVAAAAAVACLDKQYAHKFTLLTNQEIIDLERTEP